LPIEVIDVRPTIGLPLVGKEALAEIGLMANSATIAFISNVIAKACIILTRHSTDGEGMPHPDLTRRRDIS
jgi:hypothetical protein